MPGDATQYLLKLFGIGLPIIQAPMAGVSSPAMAAAVAEAGALGSISIGAVSPDDARAMIHAVRERSSAPFNVNVFVHQPARHNTVVEAAWIERLRPEFEQFEVDPPTALNEIYKSFYADEAMLAMLLDERPPVVSFHFGLPTAQQIQALRDAGITLLASATNLAEARQAAGAGVDAIVAQGFEAGGHRGVFDPAALDDQLTTAALTQLLVREIDLPVIAAGGIMDGAGINAVLQLGAAAAQLGTAFIATDESLAEEGYRAALFSDAAQHTTMTRVISGRPARSLANRFTRLGAGIAVADIPAYPIAYDLGKKLHHAARAQGDFGYGAQWAGQGAPLARAMGAAALVRVLADEIKLSRQ